MSTTQRNPNAADVVFMVDAQADAGRGLRVDVLLTFATEFLVLAATFLVLRLAARMWGPTGFGEYVLARRTLGWVQLPVLCGMHLALARYVAMATAAGDRERVAAYLRAGLLTIALSLALMWLGLFAFSDKLAFLLLANADAASTIRVLALPITGIVLHCATYGALRGLRMVRSANALQVFNLTVVPLAAILDPDVTVRTFFILVGTAWIVVSVLAIIGVYLVTPKGPISLPFAVAHARELTRYGLPRVPGEVALGALYSLPVIFSAHYSGTVEAGRVGLGLSVLQLTGAIFAPLGQVLLPSISAQLARGELSALRRRVTWIAVRGIILAIFAVAGLELLSPWLINEFFGPRFVPAVPIIRIIALAGVPYVIYILLRSVLDAMHHQPMNARNVIYSALAFLAISTLVDSAKAIPFAVVVAMTVLGGRTTYDVYRSLRDGVAVAAKDGMATPSI